MKLLILFLKAVKTKAAGQNSLFDQLDPVKGYTTQHGTFVAPHQAKHKHALKPAPAPKPAAKPAPAAPKPAPKATHKEWLEKCRKDKSIKQAFNAYKGSDYLHINKLLRNQREDDSTDRHQPSRQYLQENIDHMDRAFNSLPESMDIDVFRGIGTGLLKDFFDSCGFNQAFPKLNAKTVRDVKSIRNSRGYGIEEYLNLMLKDTKFTDKGFVSTSTSERVAGNFTWGGGDDGWSMANERTKAIFHISGKSKAIPIGEIIGVEEVNSDPEKEILLDRGHRFIIQHVEIIGDDGDYPVLVFHATTHDEDLAKAHSPSNRFVWDAGDVDVSPAPSSRFIWNAGDIEIHFPAKPLAKAFPRLILFRKVAP